jgi:hypothetical protein
LMYLVGSDDGGFGWFLEGDLWEVDQCG